MTRILQADDAAIRYANWRIYASAAGLKREIAGKEVSGTGRRRWRAQAEMRIRMARHHPPARGTHEKALLNQKRLQHVFDGAALFADGGGQAVDAHRAAVEFVDEGEQQLAVHHVDAFAINVEHVQRLLRHSAADAAVGLDLGVITHTAQQAVGDARRAARAAGDFSGALTLHHEIQNRRGTLHDRDQIVGTVKLEPLHDTETIAQRLEFYSTDDLI